MDRGGTNDGWLMKDPKALAKSYYRPDLHNELKRVALLGLGGKPVKLVLDAKVASVVSLAYDRLEHRGKPANS